MENIERKMNRGVNPEEPEVLASLKALKAANLQEFFSYKEHQPAIDEALNIFS
jgi:hypothetical protein